MRHSLQCPVPLRIPGYATGHKAVLSQPVAGWVNESREQAAMEGAHGETERVFRAGPGDIDRLETRLEQHAGTRSAKVNQHRKSLFRRTLSASVAGHGGSWLVSCHGQV